MNKKYLILRQVQGGKPTVRFIGPETEAKCMMFHIIMNSENSFKKVENDEGYEVMVTEDILEYTHGGKQGSDVRYVTYYLYPLKEKYEEY
jgi:hypothetical protein